MEDDRDEEEEEEDWIEEGHYRGNSWKKKQILKGHQDPLAHLKCAMCPYVFRLEASLSAHIACSLVFCKLHRF